MSSTQDFIANMDYLALAMFQQVRDELMEGDQMACLEVFMCQEPVKDPYSVITIAERIKKVIQDKIDKKILQKASANKFLDRKWAKQQFQIRQEQERNNFPKILEVEVEEFHKRKRKE